MSRGMFLLFTCRCGVVQKVLRRNQRKVSNIFSDGVGRLGQFRVEQFCHDPSNLSNGTHVPPTFARSAIVITRSQIQTSFAILSLPLVAPGCLVDFNLQKASMMDESSTRCRVGAHWFWRAMLPFSLANLSRKKESHPSSRWGAAKLGFSNRGVTNPDWS